MGETAMSEFRNLPDLNQPGRVQPAPEPKQPKERGPVFHFFFDNLPIKGAALVCGFLVWLIARLAG